MVMPTPINFPLTHDGILCGMMYGTILIQITILLLCIGAMVGGVIGNDRGAVMSLLDRDDGNDI